MIYCWDLVQAAISSYFRTKKGLTSQTVYSNYHDLSSPENVIMDEFQGGLEPGGGGGGESESGFPQ